VPAEKVESKALVDPAIASSAGKFDKASGHFAHLQAHPQWIKA
jgi:hypothetical protein